MTLVRVLVVDDHEPFRAAAVAVIEATAGFTLAGVADSGEESVRSAEAGHVDLVVMDVDLPGIDGLTASERVAELADPPVVMLVSTHDEEEFADRLMEVGAAAYMSKSRFGPDTLAAVWRHATAGRSYRAMTAQPRGAGGSRGPTAG